MTLANGHFPLNADISVEVLDTRNQPDSFIRDWDGAIVIFASKVHTPVTDLTIDGTQFCARTFFPADNPAVATINSLVDRFDSTGTYTLTAYLSLFVGDADVSYAIDPSVDPVVSAPFRVNV